MARSLSHSLIALLALPLAAQAIDHSYPRVSIFYGTAPTIGDSGLQKVRESVLVGLEATYPVWKGQISAAVEWRSFRARYHDVTQFSPRAADGTTLQDWNARDPMVSGNPIMAGRTGPDGVLRNAETGAVRTGYAVVNGQVTATRGYITAHTRTPGYSNQTGVLHAISADGRFDSVHMAKYDIEGGSSKIAYRQFFRVPFIGQLGVHGGLTINFLTTQEHTQGSIIVMDYRRHYEQRTNVSVNVPGGTINSSTTADSPLLAQLGQLGREFFYVDTREMKIQPGFFAGARAFVNDNFFFETNLVMLSYSQPVYVPASYSGVDPHVESSAKSKIVWEFNAGFRF